MKMPSIIASLLIALLIGMSQIVSAAPVPAPAAQARATMNPNAPQPSMSLVVSPGDLPPGGLVRASIAVQDAPGRVSVVVSGAARVSLTATGSCTTHTCDVAASGMVWMTATAGTQPLTFVVTLQNTDGVLIDQQRRVIPVLHAPTPATSGSRVYLPFVAR